MKLGWSSFQSLRTVGFFGAAICLLSCFSPSTLFAEEGEEVSSGTEKPAFQKKKSKKPKVAKKKQAMNSALGKSEKAGDEAKIPNSSTVASPSPVEPASVSLETKSAYLEKIEFGVGKKNRMGLEFQTAPLPIELTEVPSEGNAERQWQISLKIKTKVQCSLVTPITTTLVSGQWVDVIFPKKIGKHELKFVLVDREGKKQVALVKLELTSKTSAEQPEKKGGAFKSLLVGGLTYRHRSILREGTALGTSTQASAKMVGFKAIYRQGLFREYITAKIPDIRMHLDFSGIIEKSLSGDASALGYPVWGDGRVIVEKLFGRFKAEFGLGMGFYFANLTAPQPGDIKNLIEYLINVRGGWTVSSKVALLGGLTFSIPSGSLTTSSSAINAPVDVFVAVSTPLAINQALELRLRLTRFSTRGLTVGYGNFSRVETFIGPELSFVYVFL